MTAKTRTTPRSDPSGGSARSSRARREAPVRPFSRSERRRVLARARQDGVIGWDDLDALLVESASTSSKMRGLLRSLDGVAVSESLPADDMLSAEGPVSLAMESAADPELFPRYADQVRRQLRLTRAEEHTLARRLEFARERLRAAIDQANLGLDDDTRTMILERGVNCADREGEAQGGREVTAGVPCSDLTDAVLDAGALYNRLREHFVQRNLYLVIGMAGAYRTYGLPMMDLIQEGNAALIRAVEKFDWRKNVRFQTYAAFWVRQAIERLITANRGIVRVPNYVQQKMRRLRREGKLPRNHKDMDMRDVSKYFDTSAEAAARLMETDRAWFSLDVSLREDGEGSLAATIADEEQERGISPHERELLGRRLEGVLRENLTEQEQDIITLRFGLGGVSPRTLDQIGEQMSVSRERIRQMQVKALDKLQKPRLLEALKDFL